MRPPFGVLQLNYHFWNKLSSHISNERNCSFFSVIAAMNSLMTLFKKNWRRARYQGVRKNLFDLRRCAMAHNLHILARSHAPTQQTNSRPHISSRRTFPLIHSIIGRVK